MLKYIAWLFVMKEVIYLDNNGTTFMCNSAIDAQIKWCKTCQNPSSNSSIAKPSKDLLEGAKNKMLEHCGANSKYECIFTSGATESNCFIIRACVDAYHKIRKVIPTIITSTIEHESVKACCETLEENGLANITYIMPDITGRIQVNSVEEAIKTSSNIALISIMFANNELGTINNIKEIGAVAHAYNIPLHCDAVQIFGKYKIMLEKNNIDSLSMSFHKLHGPKGLGVLFVKKELINGYQLKALIAGTQQNRLRGGTENIPAIAAGIAALEETFKKREEKNVKLADFRQYIIDTLSKKYPLGNYLDYVTYAQRDDIDRFNNEPIGDKEPEIAGETIIKPFKDVELLVLGPSDPSMVLPNTLLLSVVKNVEDRYGHFCNVKLKEELDKRGVIVSIGSNCNSANKEASHVIKSIKAPAVVRRGVIRISLGDNNTKEEIREFCRSFEDAVEEQIYKQPTLKRKKSKSSIIPAVPTLVSAPTMTSSVTTSSTRANSKETRSMRQEVEPLVFDTTATDKQKKSTDSIKKSAADIVKKQVVDSKKPTVDTVKKSDMDKLKKSATDKPKKTASVGTKSKGSRN